MPANAIRQITTTYAGDVIGTEPHPPAQNAASPAVVQLLNLTTGANTINAPGGGATLAGVTIVPPAGNAVALTLKGVAGDTGIALHKTDPTSLGLDSGVASFVINAGAAVTGLRLFWT